MSTSIWDALDARAPGTWEVLLPDVMRRLILERLLFVAERLPPGETVEDLLDARDERPLAGPLSDPEVARELGWIEGVADAFDLTVLELMDRARIEIGPFSGLPRGKKPRYVRGSGGLRARARTGGVCRVEGEP